MSMAEVQSLDNLLACRNLLKASVDNSTALALALDQTGPRIAELDKRLTLLEVAIRPGGSKNGSFAAVRDHISLALGPAVAVLKILDSIRELEKSLLSDSGPDSDIFSYISTIRQFEEAMKFLTGNCNLAIQWLQGVTQFLEGNFVADDQYILSVKRSVAILEELLATGEQARRNGELLCGAFAKLEISFKQILTESSAPVGLTNSSTSTAEKACNAASPLPGTILRKLRVIVEKLNGSDRIKNCISIFVEVRSLNVRNSLRALDLDYLEKAIKEHDDFGDMESCIHDWSKHMKFIAQNVLENEHRLCKEVFGSLASHIWTGCFAKIAVDSGILSFLRFGMSIAESKKSPTKLLRLLNIFSVLEDLRMDFNKLFGGESCNEIKNITRDLVTKVVNGASEIFWELPLQVELERRSSPPSDGGVPRLLSFVTDYCNRLLDDKSRPILNQVLRIYQGWKHEKYNEGLVTNQIYRVVRETAVNLDAWSEAYEQRALSYIFMMNNHCHFNSLKGTELGNLMGDSWLNANGKYKEYYSALYLRETWGKIQAFISQDKPVSSAISDSPKKWLMAFNEAFDDMYKKQLNWVIIDESLRNKMHKLVVQTLVPSYTSYLQKYSLVVEQGGVFYTVQSLENMLSTLFKPKQVKYTSSSTISSHFTGKQRNAVIDQFRFTLTAM
ncbi:exocyst subunit exo70 family protein G1 [Hibiscus trionum]|uniref:Exocyst subunit Exo70 family protein n=1 Tax=Hibiscus trionum TaxID=183268 RepID=A0A9W7HSD8_HIBTR|nr:exocyst subunit exo70 family protein G1 [Hibiscus trionum]